MRYSGIIKNDVVNGQGVCVSIWSQGCPHKCHNCHNPETWDFNGGLEIEESKLISNVLDLIDKNDVKRNLSIIGGEPMCDQNIDFTTRLLSIVKKKFPKIKTFVWSGYTYEELLEKYDIKHIFTNLDILIDGRFESKNRDITLPLRGSSNQRVIDVQKSLQNKKVVLYELD